MRQVKKVLCLAVVILTSSLGLTSCDASNTSVYGSIGVSSGYSSYYGSYGRGYNSGSRMRGSITIGGRIR